MAYCEMCGSDTNLVKATIEGTTLNVCGRCAKFGNISPGENIQKKEKEVKIKIEPQIVYEIVNDYSLLIKNAREKLGLKQEELALRLSEKVSEIHNIESGKLKPSFKVAVKIEKVLGIKLIEQIMEQTPNKINFKESGITIGDLINMKKSKNE
jgi:putative transcription factor